MSGAGVDGWEQQLAAAWQGLETMPPDEFVAGIDALTQDSPAGEAVASFERGCARDSTGRPQDAVPLYQAALAAGLAGIRRRRAAIQLASSLRVLGRLDESLALLTVEAAAAEDELSTAVGAFLALTLVELGRDREAVAHSVRALSRHLPRYNASLARYAEALLPPPPA